MKYLYIVLVSTASGSNLQPLGLVNCSFFSGPQVLPLISSCVNLTRPLNLGLDFLRFYKICIEWSLKGDLSLSCAQQILFEPIVSMEGMKIYIKHEVNITARTLAILDVEVDIQRDDLDQLYDIQPNY